MHRYWNDYRKPSDGHLRRKYEKIDKKTALLTGATVYFGNPCKRNHEGYRYTKSNKCVICSRQAVAKWNDNKLHVPNRMVEIDRMKEEKEYDYLDIENDQI